MKRSTGTCLRNSTVQKESLNGVPVFGYGNQLVQADGTQILWDNVPNATLGAGTPFVPEKKTRLPSGLQRLEHSTKVVTVDLATGALQTERTTTAFNTDPASIVDYNKTTRTFFLTSAGGRTSSRVLDTLGRVSQLTTSGVTPIVFNYDATTGRVSSVTQGTRSTSFDYFAASSGLKAGYLSKVTNPLTQATTYDRDPLGRSIQQTVGATRPSTTSMGWDANSNLRSVTPPSKPEHVLFSNPINLLSEYAPPAAGLPASVTDYTYDLDRAPLGEFRPDGTQLSWTYDAGRPGTLTIPLSSIVHSYYPNNPPAGGAAGRLSSLVGPYSVSLGFKYDGFLPTQVTWSGGGLKTGSIDWKYDEAFQVATETVTPQVGSPQVVKFCHDVDMLRTRASVTSPSVDCALTDSGALTIGRDSGNGRVTTVYLGSTIGMLSYNGFGELTSEFLLFSLSPLATIVYDRISTIATSVARDALGRIVHKEEMFSGVSHKFDYTYDEHGWLTDVKRDGAAYEHFFYDLNGNRTSRQTNNAQTAFYDDQDRITTYEGWTFTYGRNGELQSERLGTQTYTYGYDILGNLISAGFPNGTTIAYLVDGLGRRVGKKLNGTLIKQWVYRDSLSPVAELDGAGNLISRFIYGSRPNVPDFVVRGTTKYRLLSDHLGSPRMAVNVANSTDIPYRADYRAFGGQTMVTGSADWIPFGFAGGLSDPDTGLVRFGAREFETSTGRWASKDPRRFNGGINLYTYAWNDPVNFADVTGRRPTGMGQGGSSGSGEGGAEGRGGIPYAPPRPWPTDGTHDFCGSDGSAWVPETDPLGTSNYQPACAAHDDCYGACGSNKIDCDWALGQDMMSNCNDQGDTCDIAAVSYLAGLNLPLVGGQGAFNRTQADCVCTAKGYSHGGP